MINELDSIKEELEWRKSVVADFKMLQLQIKNQNITLIIQFFIIISLLITLAVK